MNPSVVGVAGLYATPLQRDGNWRAVSGDDDAVMELPLRKTVVTGGAGFVGSHLVDRLLSGWETRVLVLDNLARGRRENLARYLDDPRVDLVVGDIADAPTVYNAIKGAEVVFHLAVAPPTVHPELDIATVFASDVIGTFNVLRAAVTHGIRRVVFASSAEVYGSPVGLPVDEAYPLQPVSLEGGMKVAGEALCRTFRNELGLDVAILRLAKIYGQRDVDSPFSVWVESAEAGRDLRVEKTQRVIDVVWVGQVVDALLRASTVERPLPPINIASGTGTSTLAMAKRIARAAGSNGGRVKVVSGGGPQVRPFIASVERMKEILGIEPFTDPLRHLEDLVVRTHAVAT